MLPFLLTSKPEPLSHLWLLLRVRWLYILKEDNLKTFKKYTQHTHNSKLPNHVVIPGDNPIIFGVSLPQAALSRVGSFHPFLFAIPRDHPPLHFFPCVSERVRHTQNSVSELHPTSRPVPFPPQNTTCFGPLQSPPPGRRTLCSPLPSFTGPGL